MLLSGERRLRRPSISLTVIRSFRAPSVGKYRRIDRATTSDDTASRYGAQLTDLRSAHLRRIGTGPGPDRIRDRTSHGPTPRGPDELRIARLHHRISRHRLRRRRRNRHLGNVPQHKHVHTANHPNSSATFSQRMVNPMQPCTDAQSTGRPRWIASVQFGSERVSFAVSGPVDWNVYPWVPAS